MPRDDRYRVGIYADWHNPDSIPNYKAKIVPGTTFIMLPQYPSPNHRFIIKDFIQVENREDIVNKNEFCVDYKEGFVYFHPSLQDTWITIKEFYGIGINRIDAKRVVTKLDATGNVVQVLQDIIDAYKEIFEALANAMQLVKDVQYSLEVLESTQNPTFIVAKDQWTEYTEGGITKYKATINHNLLSKNLQITAIDIATDMNMGSPPFKTIDFDNIEVYSLEAEDIKYIISASYYNGLVDNDRTNEVLTELYDARLGEPTLKDKLLKIIGGLTVVNIEWFGGVGDGYEDNTQAFQDAINYISSTGGTIYFPSGTYVFDNPKIYINSRKTITIIGQGAFSTILKFTNISSDYAMYVNENENGTVYKNLIGAHMIKIHNIAFNGSDSTKGIIKNRTNGIEVENVEVRHCRNFIENFGYSDNITLKRIQVFDQVDGGWLFTQNDYSSMGDNCVFEQLFALSAQMVRLVNCGGATFDAINGGYYKFILCKSINWSGSHQEFSGSKPAIDINNSKITFRSSQFHNNCRENMTTLEEGKPPIYINDLVNLKTGSNVSFEDCMFIRRITRGWDNTTRPDDIFIKNMLTTTRISFHNCMGLTDPNSRNIGDETGVLVGYDTTNDTTIDKTLKRSCLSFTRDCTIGYIANRVMIMDSNGNCKPHIDEMPKPTVSISETTAVGETLSPGTYYYKMFVCTHMNRHGLPSDEISITKKSANSAILINCIGHQNAYCVIYRGTKSNVYTEYAITPFYARQVNLYDTGRNVSGIAWKDISTIYFNILSETYNTTAIGKIDLLKNTIDGKVDSINDTRLFYVGDIIEVNDNTFGGIRKLICSSKDKGYNGLRLLEQNGIKRNTTANRPNLHDAISGYQYFDTTINKMIIWVGGKWYDFNGNEV